MTKTIGKKRSIESSKWWEIETDHSKTAPNDSFPRIDDHANEVNMNKHKKYGNSVDTNKLTEASPNDLKKNKKYLLYNTKTHQKIIAEYTGENEKVFKDHLLEGFTYFFKDQHLGKIIITAKIYDQEEEEELWETMNDYKKNKDEYPYKNTKPDDPILSFNHDNDDDINIFIPKSDEIMARNIDMPNAAHHFTKSFFSPYLKSKSPKSPKTKRRGGKSKKEKKTVKRKKRYNL